VAPGNGPWLSDKNKPYLDELSHLRTAMENIARNNPDPGPLWEAIMLSRQIAVHAPGEIVEPRMEMLIVLE